LAACSNELPLVFTVHPRTRKRLEEFNLMERLKALRRMTVTDPLGYIEFMNLVVSSRAAITDSGGVQEETTYLGIPCLTLRENTERPITVSHGTNRLIKASELCQRVSEVLANRWQIGQRPDNWDGKTAARCADALERRYLNSQ
jgi:UDP-N-acetylglucosamine 2-epimerase (non-hydrolysing)